MKYASAVFRALADPTRRQILQQLKEGELSAGEIADFFTISGPSISRHLSILKNAELIVERRDGNRRRQSREFHVDAPCCSPRQRLAHAGTQHRARGCSARIFSPAGLTSS